MASVNSFETDMRKLRKKRKRKRALKNLMMMLIVVAFAAAVYLSKDLWLPYLEGVLERGMSDSDETSGVENFPIDISSRSNVSIDAMDSCWTLFTDTTFYTCLSDGNRAVLNTLAVFKSCNRNDFKARACLRYGRIQPHSRQQKQRGIFKTP